MIDSYGAGETNRTSDLLITNHSSKPDQVFDFARDGTAVSDKFFAVFRGSSARERQQFVRKKEAA